MCFISTFISLMMMIFIMIKYQALCIETSILPYPYEMM